MAVDVVVVGGGIIGTAIAHRLAGLIGGELRVESGVDSGSTFTLLVPEHEEK